MRLESKLQSLILNTLNWVWHWRTVNFSLRYIKYMNLYCTWQIKFISELRTWLSLYLVQRPVPLLLSVICCQYIRHTQTQNCYAWLMTIPLVESLLSLSEVLRLTLITKIKSLTKSHLTKRILRISNIKINFVGCFLEIQKANCGFKSRFQLIPP